MPLIRPYDPTRDHEAAHRLYREVGWSDGSANAQEATECHLRAARALVAELEGSVENLVLTCRATLRYLQEDLPLCAVTDVLTGHVARQQGLAARTTAQVLAQAAAQGELAAALGIFDQGYYNRLGFGNGAYDFRVRFDPGSLQCTGSHRPPRRLGRDDWQAMHAARLQRLRSHGAFNIHAPEMTQAEILSSRSGFGLGYADGPDGALSHYVWCSASNMEHGPFHVRWLVYRTAGQLLELLSLLRSLGDQARTISLIEPPGIQWQDLISWPFRRWEMSEGSEYPQGVSARAWWQFRILDLPGCLARTHLGGPGLRFNLLLSDPVARYLDEDTPWRGIAGEYIVALGPESSAAPGHDASLPTLEASVNAFSRLWLGVRPASGLAITDDLQGPPELLQALDRVLCLPRPVPDWEF